MAKANKQAKSQKIDPVAKYAQFTNSRSDMTEEQKKEAITHYKQRVQLQSARA